MSFFQSWFPQHCKGCRCFESATLDTTPDEDLDEFEVEEENEERELPLANEPDLQSPPHTHTWGMWEIVKEGTITRYNHDTWTNDEIGSYIDQRRRCEGCGKYELDTQVSYAVED
jgi:hypothetical protein